MAVGRATSWSGFHNLDPAARLAKVATWAGLSAAEKQALAAASGLPTALATSFIENAVGSYPLPLGFAVHFQVDAKPAVVPMAVEESSVIAAASHGAKLAAAGGGFATKGGNDTTIGQVELRGGIQLAAAKRVLSRNRRAWMRDLDALVPGMVARGGGVRAITLRAVGRQRLVIHLEVDTRDAMGANVVNTLAEAAAPWMAEAFEARPGLRILSNLATGRLTTASCIVPSELVGGAAGVRGIVDANRFALDDPFRAATHNKGILNGIDPVLIATGNDWRAMEAGAHAYAAISGRYRALTEYKRRKDGDLAASLTLPVQLGTVGGVTRLHPVAAACLKVLGSPDAARLSAIVASVGLAQNLAALRALSQEGIQAGHMRLHASNLALARAGLHGTVQKS